MQSNTDNVIVQSADSEKMIAMLRQTIPQKIAEEICSVQSFDNMPKDWHKDPLLNQMLTNFVNRIRNK